MKKLIEAAGVFCMLAIFAWAIWMIAGVVVSNSKGMVQRCRDLRQDFFASCMAAEPRYRCEVQWAQLGDKVFDATPEQSFSDQVDCTGKFED